MPVTADEDDVRLAAEHLNDEPLFDRRAEFIPPVEVEDEHALKIRLGNTRDARTDEVLARSIQNIGGSAWGFQTCRA